MTKVLYVEIGLNKEGKYGKKGISGNLLDDICLLNEQAVGRDISLMSIH